MMMVLVNILNQDMIVMLTVYLTLIMMVFVMSLRLQVVQILMPVTIIQKQQMRMIRVFII